MRRNKLDTAASRARIVTEAAKLLRVQGPEKLSVAAVMAAAGMTHGGFYSHFASKDALIDAATEAAFSEKLDYLAGLGDEERRTALLRYVDGYLTSAHVDDLSSGCPIAGLSGDVARAEGGLSETLSAGALRTVQALARDLTGNSPRPEADAIRVLASMIGAVVLGRALRGTDLQYEALAAVREMEPLRSLLRPDAT